MKPELQKMRRHLVGWLDARGALRAISTGRIPGDRAKASAALARYLPEERALAAKLTEVLLSADPSAELPDDPEALAKVALANSSLTTARQGLGIFPLVAVAAGALIVMYSIGTIAEQAEKKRKEELCKMGVKEYCPTNWGKWLVIGGLIIGGWWYLNNTTSGKQIKRKLLSA